VDRLLKAYQYFHSHNKVTFRLVHRLDRDTSGVLVVAKTLKMAHYLADQFKFHHMQKTYWAVVMPKAPQQKGVIDAPLIKNEKGRGGEMMMVDFEEGKPAKTDYRVLKSFNHMSFMEFKPQSGRTHQIRVHAAWLGCPILGDGKYGEPSSETLHLHARAIKFKTAENDTLTFVAEPPHHIVETFEINGINWEEFA
jgi:23S rRNA pseudouridine955/2504/2580 synthase